MPEVRTRRVHGNTAFREESTFGQRIARILLWFEVVYRAKAEFWRIVYSDPERYGVFFTEKTYKERHVLSGKGEIPDDQQEEGFTEAVEPVTAARRLERFFAARTRHSPPVRPTDGGGVEGRGAGTRPEPQPPEEETGGSPRDRGTVADPGEESSA